MLGLLVKVLQLLFTELMKLQLLRVQRLASFTLVNLLFLLWFLENETSLRCFMLVLNCSMKASIDVILQDEIRGLCLLCSLECLCGMVIIKFDALLSWENIISTLIWVGLFI